jgi:hypothetical protein
VRIALLFCFLLAACTRIDAEYTDESRIAASEYAVGVALKAEAISQTCMSLLPPGVGDNKEAFAKWVVQNRGYATAAGLWREKLYAEIARTEGAEAAARLKKKFEEASTQLLQREIRGLLKGNVVDVGRCNSFASFLRTDASNLSAHPEFGPYMAGFVAAFPAVRNQ